MSHVDRLNMGCRRRKSGHWLYPPTLEMLPPSLRPGLVRQKLLCVRTQRVKFLLLVSSTTWQMLPRMEGVIDRIGNIDILYYFVIECKSFLLFFLVIDWGFSLLFLRGKSILINRYFLFLNKFFQKFIFFVIFSALSGFCGVCR